MTAINVNLIAPIHSSQMEPFRVILEELGKAVPMPLEVSHIEIRVVPRRSTGLEANRILGRQEYSDVSPAYGALIIPRSNDNHLECIILIGVEEFDGLTDTNRPAGLIASLLEELLHAQVYGVRWSVQGNFLPADPSQDDAFDAIASRVHDEYVVSRAKNQIASQLPLFDAPGMPGYRTMQLFSYGGDISTLMSKAEIDIEALTRTYQEEALDLTELQSHILNGVVFRRMIDPLSRSYGFADGMPANDRKRSVLTLPQSALSRSLVEPHWQQIYKHLCQSYASHLENAASAIRSIAYEVRILSQKLEYQIRFPPVDE